MTAEPIASPEAPPVPYRRLGHRPALDGIRGVAVILVLLSHTSVLVPSLFPGFLPGSFIGVDMFFVLSGFLIATLLLTEQERTARLSYRRFYQRRALRLLPALACLLIAQFVYAAATDVDPHVEITSLLAVALYVGNYFWASGHTIAEGLQHTWSLSVEEQFYFVFPIVTGLVLGITRSLKTAVTILLVAICAFALWRAWLWNPDYGVLQTKNVYPRTDARADELLIGVLLAHLWIRGRTPRRGLVVAGLLGAAAIVAFTLFVQQWDNFPYYGGYTLMAVATAAIILSVLDARGPTRAFFEWRWLRTVGIVSYGVYLYHLLVFFILQHFADDIAPVPLVVLAWVITGVVAAASYIFIERPFLRMKDRLHTAAEET